MSSKKRSSRISFMSTSTSSNGDGDSSSHNNSSIYEQSRLQEKTTLNNLNGRLQSYIDRVRQLENENSGLKVQIKDIEIVEKKEKNNLLEQYEKEKERLRLLLDMAREEANMAIIDRDKARALSDQLEPRVRKLEADLKQAEDARLAALTKQETATANERSMRAHLDKIEKDHAALKREFESMRAQLLSAQKGLEDEMKMRTQAQQKARDLAEDLEFEKKKYKKEIEEVSRKRQVDMTAITKQVNADYQVRHKEEMAALRKELQDQMGKKNRKDLDAAAAKINELQDRAQQKENEANSFRIRVHELESSGSSNADMIDNLRRQLEKQKTSFDLSQSAMQDMLKSKDKEIFQLRDELAALKEDYDALLDVKVELDTELAAYRMMLEAEETRLNLSQPQETIHRASYKSTSTSGSSSAFSSSARRGTKRARYQIDGEDTDNVEFHHEKHQMNKEAYGPIAIDDIDSTWIRLINNSEESVSIGKWKIVGQAGTQETSYTFSQRMSIAPGETLTVHSSGTGRHLLPNELMMKSQVWPSGDNASVTLVDADGEEQAKLTLGTTVTDDAEGASDRCVLM